MTRFPCRCTFLRNSKIGFRICAPLLLLFLAVGCTATAPAAKFIAQADHLHDAALATTVMSDSEVNDYIQEVAARVATAAMQVAPKKTNAEFLSKVRCHLVNSDTVNVYCTGGTHIYLYNGVFQQCQNEDQLAAVIAHAYAHLINLDLEATHMRPDVNLPLPTAVWDFITNRFTLSQERESDHLAMAIYAHGGWDPAQAVGLFEHLEALTGGNISSDRDALPLRISILQGIAADVQRTQRVLPVADPKTFLYLRKQGAKFQEGPTPSVAQIFLRALPNCLLSADTAQQREAQERLRPLPPPPPQGREPN